MFSEKERGRKLLVFFFFKKKKESSLTCSIQWMNLESVPFIYGCMYGAERLTIDAVSLLYNSVRASISWHKHMKGI